MKFYLSFLLGFVLLLVFPAESELQAGNFLQDRRSTFRAASQSQPPGGSRRPLGLSRRSLALQRIGWDVGGNIGTSHSLTDVSGTSVDQKPSFLNTQWSTTSLNVGVFGRYKFNPIFAVRGSVNYGRVHGADSLAEGRSRDFYFDNNIVELAVVYEVYIPKRTPAMPLDIYGFIGLAGFYHNPNLTVPDPDNFEFEEYSNFQPAIPMGVGANYYFFNGMKVGLEVGWRKTFFDYLDGFTRPWSQGSDSYYFTQLKVSYFLPQMRRRW